ncbi:MAG: ribbon-helix-helix protein, CopG family [Armatimonadetes bacterium]|nr:ribbon-helix-helix protein, CopG family [Armatimonadota bacterium]
MKKVTITLPDEQAAAIEQIRRRRGLSRSRVVQQAIAMSLAEQEKARAVRRYEEGYRKHPEASEATAYAKATAATLARERWP